MEQDILSILLRLGKNPRTYKEYFQVQCLFPDHQDNDPSMYIHRQNGYFKCYGCGRHGSIQKLFNELGHSLSSPLPVSVITDQWQRTLQEKPAPKTYLPSDTLFTLPYRSYPANFIQATGARFWVDNFGNERIVIPFYQRKILVGYTARALQKDAWPKYRHVNGMPSEQILYPYDAVQSKKPLILVEGPFDALRFWTNGMQALAILGTNNWSAFKKRLLIAKLPSIVLIVMDGDAAGKKAASVIYNDLFRYMKVHVENLPDESDPDSVTQDWINWFYTNIYCGFGPV